MNIKLDLKPNQINSDTISRASLSYMKEAFDRWCVSLDIDDNPNYLGHIYIITYFGDALDSYWLMANFCDTNKNLIYEMTYGQCGFHKFLPIQHSGIFFVDCEGSRNGYIQNMTGLHIHAAVVVHPNWREKFENAFGGLRVAQSKILHPEGREVLIGNYPNNGMLIEKVNPTEADALKVISYCAKSIVHKKGIYHGREDLYGMLGHAESTNKDSVYIRKSKRIVHQLNRSSLTGGSY